MKHATPFSKILVANRGEIALRVMRSARALGYGTVAVYSTADAGSPHVREADQAVCIGEPAALSSYLRISALIEAARRTAADAVHPGYGFLAENADFANACIDAGLVFIGPSPGAIEAMGNKAGAKRLMAAAGVPCIPGYQGEDQSDSRLAEEAGRLGYPLMIKATSGGGGRGMRLVRDADGFGDALRSARSEAANAFGDTTVLLERAILEPRHIEIQIVADRYGHVLHLGERDCSVQRRHQKLLEEAPSPVVSAALRDRMGAVAVRAARAIGYEGAGTLEFLLDRHGDFYFMEMNTRLQVEHPVTEAITGLDLVELQLRIAAGEPLEISQDQVHLSGHAIEARLCAEDASQDFMPQSGKMVLWHAPTHGPARLRVEHALESGAEISAHYDSMIAKLIAHGTTREEARRKLARGLETLVALGVTTNRGFLASCLEHSVFAAGEATTDFIQRYRAELLRDDPEADARATAVAALLLMQGGTETRPPLAGGALIRPLPMRLRLEMGGGGRELTMVRQGQRTYIAEGGGHRHVLDLIDFGHHRIRFVCDDVMETATYFRDGATLLLQLGSRSYRVKNLTHVAHSQPGTASGSDGRLRASMNGRVVAVLVAAGESVAPGQPLVTVEAMKMEHIHASPVAGTVRALHVSAGDQVSAAGLLAEIAIEEDAPSGSRESLSSETGRTHPPSP
ncbi:MAG: acetyl-CoA carboxylase biotin carboxylase subunit [Burkholderiaceae bacterium]|nr:acetyl-CoA carboxylase biotin carboxylase subunit [Burkholderiaceae bacterium]